VKHPLEVLAKVPIQITWHENRRTYLSVQKKGTVYHLRIHRLFHDAPSPVFEALLDYAMKRSPRAKAVIKQMAHLYFSKTRAAPKPVNPSGQAYNLQEILGRVKKMLFVEDLSIGWAQFPKRASSFRSITFGTYNHHAREIRIHPFLDDANVPLYFLEYIVYHEMLHAVCPSKMDLNGKCKIHTREFREKERLFPHFAQAKRWEKGSIEYFKKRQREWQGIASGQTSSTAKSGPIRRKEKFSRALSKRSSAPSSKGAPIQRVTPS
jgi:hypothetical protein